MVVELNVGCRVLEYLSNKINLTKNKFLKSKF